MAQGSANLMYPITEGSVMGIRPREAMTLSVTEGRHGWYAMAYTGKGNKPGSVIAGAGSFSTAEEAFSYLLERTQKEA